MLGPVLRTRAAPRKLSLKITNSLEPTIYRRETRFVFLPAHGSE